MGPLTPFITVHQ